MKFRNKKCIGTTEFILYKNKSEAELGHNSIKRDLIVRSKNSFYLGLTIDEKFAW